MSFQCRVNKYFTHCMDFVLDFSWTHKLQQKKVHWSIKLVSFIEYCFISTDNWQNSIVKTFWNQNVPMGHFEIKILLLLRRQLRSLRLDIFYSDKKISGMGELEMDSRPFPAPLPHGNPVPFPPPPESRLRTNVTTITHSPKYTDVRSKNTMFKPMIEFDFSEDYL